MRYPGVPVIAGDHEYVVPALPLGALELLWPRLQSGLDPDLAVDLVHAALVRQYLDTTRDAVIQLRNEGWLQVLLTAAIQASGLLDLDDEESGNEEKHENVSSGDSVDWDYLFAHLVTATGMNWEDCRWQLDLKRFKALKRYWKELPPVHMELHKIAAALGIGPSEKDSGSGSSGGGYQDLGELMQMLPQG